MTTTATTTAVLDQLVRLNKLLVAKIGGMSRREADRYISAGWVRVNGVVTDQLGAKVAETAELQLAAAARNRMQENRATSVILHKPLGVVSCQPDTPQHVPAIKLLTHGNMFGGGLSPKGGSRSSSSRSSTLSNAMTEPYRLSNLAVAGRLDVNSTGLLLFTRCGKMASDIVGPRSTVEKEYLVRLNPVRYGVGALFQQEDGDDGNDNSNNNSGEALLEERIEQLRNGIECSGEFLEAVYVDPLNADQLRITLRAGKKHHIRRMVEAVGWSVQALKRVRIGNISLGNLPRGQWRYLKPDENVL